MPQPIDNQLALLKRIADETQFKILLMPKDGERCVCEIFRGLGKEQSLISHHLQVARRCGLVKSVRQGKLIRYKLADLSIAELLAKLERCPTNSMVLGVGQNVEQNLRMLANPPPRAERSRARPCASAWYGCREAAVPSYH